MRTRIAWQKCWPLLLVALILAACSTRAPTLATPPAALTTQPEETHPTLYPQVSATASEEGDQDSPTEAPFSSEIRTYHAVLMLERAADLMMTVIEKIHRGEILISDSEAISLYNNSFVLAAESFNEAHPPVEYSDIWSRVYAVTRQYNVVYLWLIQGISISEENLSLLRESRKFLTLDQELIEKFLSPRLGKEFIAEQQKAVDQHFEEGYGDKLVPSLLP